MKSAAASVILLVFVLCGCGRFEGTFHFLHDEPNANLIPNVYVLDKGSYSYGMLRQMGYENLSVSLELLDDGRFRLSNMPDCWLTDWSESHDGYDSCEGSWTVRESDAVYSLSINIESWSPESTYYQENENKRVRYSGAFILTKEKNAYGLAFGLGAGDDGWIYFIPQTTANKTGDLTAEAAPHP